MATVFISHAGRDRELTEGVASRLREAGLGLSVDFDLHDGIPAGANWEDVLYRRVRSADAVLLVLTSAVAESSWCEVEVRYARALGRVVFVLRAETGLARPDLSEVQWLESSDPGWPDRLRDGLVAQGIHPDGPLDWDRRRDPYPGLAPFGPTDAGVFFAREEEIRWLVDRLEETDALAVLAVVGRSGSGKSSLVHAGLLPRVPESWFVLPPIRPGRDPVRALARRVVSALAKRHVERDPDAVVADLEASPEKIAGLLDELADAASSTSRRAVLLVVDQAEELRTLAEPEQARRFLELVGHMARAQARVCVVMTVRSDAVDAGPGLPGLAALRPERLDLEPISRDRLHEVIERPASRAGIGFDEGLVERIAGDAGSGDALPLLALTLRELVQGDLGPRRLVTWQRYAEVGGVLEALDARATRISRGLERKGHSEAEVTIPTMLRFAELSDQPDPVSRPVDYTGLDEPGRAVVDDFVEARLLTRSAGEIGGRASVTVRVAHEALLRSWARLEAAIREVGDGLRLHGELARLAGDWVREDRDENYLLTGDRLRRVEALRDGRMPRVHDEAAPAPPTVRLDFSTREREFLDASRAREDDRARRRRRRRALFAVVLVLALLGGAVAVVAGMRARTANAEATSRALSAAAVDTAPRNPGAGAMLAIAAYRASPTAEADQALFDRYIATQGLGSVFSGAPGNLREAQVSRDGRVVAGLTDNGLLTTWSRTPSGGIEQREALPSAEAESMGLSPDGTTVWLKRRAGLTRYDVATGAVRIVGPLEPTDVIDTPVAVSADGGTIASVVGIGPTSVLRTWDTTTGRVLADLPRPSELSTTFVEFGPGRTLVIGNELADRTVQRWTPGDPAPPTVIATGVSATALAAGSGTIVVCQSPPFPTVIDVGAPIPPPVVSAVRVSDGTVLRTLTASEGSCGNLATDAEGAVATTLSTSDNLVAAGNDSGIFDLAGGRSTTFSSPLRGPADSRGIPPRVLPGLVPGPHGPQAAVVSTSGVTLVPVPDVAGVVPDAIWVGLTDDGTSQLVVADNGATLIHATALESPGRTLATAPRPVPAWRTAAGDLATSGSLVADRVSADRVVVRHLPDLATVAELPTEPVVSVGAAPEDLINRSISFDAAGDLLVTVGADVTVWDTARGRRIGQVDLEAMGLAARGGLLAVRPGRVPSQLVVVAADRPDVHVVDIATSREVGRLPTGPDVLAAALDPTGRYVVLARRGGTFEVWDTRSNSRVLGPLPTVPPGPVVDPITAVTAGFIDDAGDLMIGAGSRIRVFDVASPTPIRTLDVGAGQQVSDMSADGHVIITFPAQGTGRTLSLRPSDWVNTICQVIGRRSFTDTERDAAPVPLPDGTFCPVS